MSMLLIAIFILILLLVLIAVVMVRKKKRKHATDYYTLFIIGIVWTAAGVPLDMYVLSGMGLAFMAVGLANKDKWKKNHRSFNKMNKEEKQLLLLVILVGLCVLSLGILAYFIAR